MPSSTKPLIAALLFDLDDTLWPIAPVIGRAEQQLFDWISKNAPAVAERHSIVSLRQRRADMIREQPHLRADLVALRHACLTEAFSACGENLAGVDEAMHVFTRARNQVTLYADVDEMLPRLAKRVRLGSLTNGAADLVTIGLAHHFEISVAAHQLGIIKPDPALFHAACDALQLPPSQVAYVGDDLRLDVEGAQKAGLTGIWVNRSETATDPALSHIKPDLSIRSLHELEYWLDELGRPQ